MPRLPPADPAALEPEGRAMYEASRLEVTRVLAHAAGAYTPWRRALTAITESPDLDPVLRELVILRAAARAGSKYEWAQHEPRALAAGVTPEHIEAVRTGTPVGGREGLVISFLDDLFEDRRPDDRRVAELLEAISPRLLVEVILLTGVYTTVARVIEAADIPPEPFREVSQDR